MKRGWIAVLVLFCTGIVWGQGTPVIPYIDSFWRDIIDESDTEVYGLDLSSGTWSSAVMNWDADPSVYANGTRIINFDGTLYNVFLGTSNFLNDAGQSNVGLGYATGYYNDTTGAGIEGETNIYIGYLTGFGDAGGNTGYGNIGIGSTAMYSNTSGYLDVGVGANALLYNTTGYYNMAVGANAAAYNNVGNNNSAIGGFSLYFNQSGSNNTVIGYFAGYGVISNSYSNNTYIGSLSGQGTTTGGSNLAIGYQSLPLLTTGTRMTGLGYHAGFSSTTATDCVYIGYKSGYNQITNSNLLIIDNQDRGSAANEAAKSLIYGIFDADPANQDLTFNADVGIGKTSPTAALQMGDDKLIAADVNAGITASTIQSQGQGALTAQVNEISTVANKDDTVTLPSAVTGIMIEIINNGANTLLIFPASGDDMGLGVNNAEELQANERVKFVAYDTTNWAKESSTEIIHAEIHDEDNTDAFVINDPGGDFHSYHTNGLTSGDLADWTFDAGGAGTSFPIASIANSVGSPGTQILVTTTGAHGLAVGDIISQTNLADAAYVGIFEVKATAAATTYEVTASYTADGTGTMDQAATLTADAVAAGVYDFAYYISATPVGNNETFDFQLYKEATVITGSKIRRKFGAANDFGSMSGGGVVPVVNGDKISFSLSNEDSAANLIIRNFTLVLIRL